MTELQQNRYDKLLRRVGGLIGAKSMVNDALGELFPTIDVENVPAELLALMGTQPNWCSTLLQASAGNFNHHQLFNPADSQALLVVTTVAMHQSGSGFLRIGNCLGQLGTLAGNERRRDTRAGILENQVGQSRTSQDTVNGCLDFRVFTPGNVESIFLKDANAVSVLFPGTGLSVSSEIVNTQTQVSFMWRERVFELTEEIAVG